MSDVQEAAARLMAPTSIRDGVQMARDIQTVARFALDGGARIAEAEQEVERLREALLADINRLAAQLSAVQTVSDYRFVLLTAARNYLEHAQRNGDETVQPLIADIHAALAPEAGQPADAGGVYSPEYDRDVIFTTEGAGGE